jgi:hypothetical protein
MVIFRHLPGSHGTETEQGLIWSYGFDTNRQEALSYTSLLSVVSYVIAEARDPRQQPFAFQHAQCFAAG